MRSTLDAWRERAGSAELRRTDSRECPQGDSDREQHTESDEVGQAHAAAPSKPGRPGQLTGRRLCRFGTLLSSRARTQRAGNPTHRPGCAASGHVTANVQSGRAVASSIALVARDDRRTGAGVRVLGRRPAVLPGCCADDPRPSRLASRRDGQRTPGAVFVFLLALVAPVFLAVLVYLAVRNAN